MNNEFRRGMEAAARIADAYAAENFQMANDTILTDPVLSGRDRSESGFAVSERLRIDGCIHSSMAHAAHNISMAIREARDARPV